MFLLFWLRKLPEFYFLEFFFYYFLDFFFIIITIHVTYPQSVHLHLIPWFAESKDPDAVYSYVASYKRHFSEAEGTLAAAFLKADESALRSLLYP